MCFLAWYDIPVLYRVSKAEFTVHKVSPHFFTTFWLLLKIKDLAISHLTNYLLYNAEMPGIQTMFENGLVFYSFPIMHHLEINI